MNRSRSILSNAPAVVAAGALMGLVAAILEQWGNPPNMGICVVCFERDITGALGLHPLAGLRNLRPEIIGFVLGATASALVFREFRPRSGSAPLLRFVLGVFAAVGALVFMGCTWRMLCRLSGLDLTALVGVAGLVVGVAVAGRLQQRSFRPGAASPAPTAIGWIVPGGMIGLLLLAILEPTLGKEGFSFTSASGPGSEAAPLLVSLGGGLILGLLLQRSRICTVGAIHKAIFGGRRRMLIGLLAFVAVGLAVKLVVADPRFGYRAQPLAHSNALWNFLGMVLAGLAFTLAGGCPGRQLVLAGEGDADAGIFVIGVLAGAALSHNLLLAAGPDKMVEGALEIGGPAVPGQVAVVLGIVCCLVFGRFVNRPKAS